jgi:ABC-type multidrug transport system fused ATPase/permease subunit
MKRLGIYFIVPFKVAPLYALLNIVKRVLDGLIPLVQVLVTAAFIESVIGAFDHTGELSAVALWIGAMVACIAVPQLLNMLMQFVNIKFNHKMNFYISDRNIKKRSSLEYKHIENQEDWDIISRVTGGMEGKLIGGFQNILSLVTLCIQIIGVFLILFTQSWWLALVVLVCMVPIGIVSVKSGKANYNIGKELTKTCRRYDYIFGILTNRDTVEERTLFNFSDHYEQVWNDEYETARKKMFLLDLKWYMRMKSSSFVMTGASIVITAFMAVSVFANRLSLGLFVSLINQIFELIQTVSWQLNTILIELTKSIEYSKEYKTFYEMSETEGIWDEPLAQSIPFESLELSNVTFTYPGMEACILKGINMKIEKNKHYSIVGANGAGKTSLIKILIGLYDNYEGEILLNGVDLRSFTAQERKSLLSVVFQDYAKYCVSFKDNIALGNILKMDHPAMDTDIDNAVATFHLGEVVERLPEKMDTTLGKLHEGSLDLSGGEWQRVALSRAYVSQNPITVLDEPTAALDPISESNMYQQFNTISKAKTTIFISHRLGSTQLVDEIYLIDQGVVKEHGTHEELMKIQGLYAEMYTSQRSWYQ